MQDRSIKMCPSNAVSKLVVVAAASGTILLLRFISIVHERCSIFLPVIVEGQSNFFRALWMLMFVPPLEQVICIKWGLWIFILSR